MDPDLFAKLDQQARERANRLAPMPKIEASEAGIRGLFVTAIVIAVFGALAGFGSGAFPAATGITAALGFLIPFGYVKYCRHLYYKEWSRAFNSLRQLNELPANRDAAGRPSE